MTKIVGFVVFFQYMLCVCTCILKHRDSNLCRVSRFYFIMYNITYYYHWARLVAHTCNSSTWEAEASGFLQGPGQPHLCDEFHVSQHYSKTKTNKEPNSLLHAPYDSLLCISWKSHHARPHLTNHKSCSHSEGWEGQSQRTSRLDGPLHHRQPLLAGPHMASSRQLTEAFCERTCPLHESSVLMTYQPYLLTLPSLMGYEFGLWILRGHRHTGHLIRHFNKYLKGRLLFPPH